MAAARPLKDFAIFMHNNKCFPITLSFSRDIKGENKVNALIYYRKNNIDFPVKITLHVIGCLITQLA